MRDAYRMKDSPMSITKRMVGVLSRVGGDHRLLLLDMRQAVVAMIEV